MWLELEIELVLVLVLVEPRICATRKGRFESRSLFATANWPHANTTLDPLSPKRHRERRHRLINPLVRQLLLIISHSIFSRSGERHCPSGSSHSLAGRMGDATRDSILAMF